MVWALVTVLVLVGYGGLIRYYYGHFKKIPRFSATGSAPQTFVSVIVAARNEEKTVPHLLNALALQAYPKHLFEVIVVDDFSTDNTLAVVQTFSDLYVQVVQPGVAPALSSKKRAIEAGVNKAKGPLLLITDADCVPGTEWIKTVAAFYEAKRAVFIAAPVKFTQDGSLLQLFQGLDFITLQGITAASVAAQSHAMCNGANLAYTKKAFEGVDGFAGIDHIASGDDMLLMYKIGKREKGGVQYLLSTDAMVTTAPAPSWNAFFSQRRRWASKTRHYDDKRVFAVLLFVYLFNCWFLVLLVAGFWSGAAWLTAIGYLFLKTSIEWPFVKAAATFYSEEKKMRYFPFLQPLHVFYTIAIGIISQLGRYEWKGRKTK